MHEWNPWHTVAEARSFSAGADSLLSPEEHAAVINSIARDPEGGDLIPGGDGLRKRRISLGGRGKRGGARVITLYLGEHVPVYAIVIFAKNERADMSPDQRKAVTRVVRELKAMAARTRR